MNPSCIRCLAGVLLRALAGTANGAGRYFEVPDPPSDLEERTYEPIDDIDKISCRPDFAIAAYSGYLKAEDKDELAPGLRLPANTPPIFLVHGGAGWCLGFPAAQRTKCLKESLVAEAELAVAADRGRVLSIRVY